MNKTSLYTSGKKFPNDGKFYVVSVFDLEPSGVLLQAYNQESSKEYLLSVSEKEVKLLKYYIQILFSRPYSVLLIGDDSDDRMWFWFW